MTKKLQIGNDIFDYPVQGDGNWGEEATAWAEAVTEALQNVQGPNDILITSAVLDNDQSTPAAIAGLQFNTTDVLSVRIEYFIKREGTSTETEQGFVDANFDGVNWKSNQESVGDVGVIFTFDASGQVFYISSDFPGHTSSTIRFRARTIDEP
jgi:opacity protein-like surface antigen